MNAPMNILIVEGMTPSLDALEDTVRAAAAKYFDPVAIQTALCYDDALKKIQNNTYGIIFVTHFMPRTDTGDLEQRDLIEYCRLFDGIGYGLIASIREKNPKTIVVGTSPAVSAHFAEFPKPDYQLDKLGGRIARDVNEILAKTKKP